MGVFYAIAEVEGRKSITVYSNGEIFSATDARPDFDTLVDKARAGDESVLDMFEPVKAITKRFVKITDRVTIRGGQILFDNDAVDDSVSAAILRAMEQGEDDWAPLVLFLEKLYSNPNEHSRTQLYRWLATHNFTIAADGDILGYKAVERDGLSSHSGTAIVDGEVVNGRIPNKVGSTIEMPRSEVQFDPSVGCHTGLHVGTWDYARTFLSNGNMLLVKFNPRDVVSVPTDCNDAKVRVCRYTVVEGIDEALTETISWDYSDNDDADSLLDEVETSSLVE